MKKIIWTVLVSSILIASCAIKIIPLKGSYPNIPMEMTTNKTFDQVWDKLIDLYAQKGVSIKIIDRSSGLIISDKTPLQATTEDINGKIIEPRALIVVPTQMVNGRLTPINGTQSGAYAKILTPNPVFGDWNVRIKKTETGCIINVNIVNVFYYDHVVAGYSAVQQVHSMTDFKSTGNFENEIANYIK